MLEVKNDSDDCESYFACFIPSDKHCFKKLMGSSFLLTDSVLIRGWEQDENILQNSKKRKRDPIGLSLRWAVLSRDGFQCVICGKSGKDARIEIDHIIPVCNGGTSVLENLRVLCFDCNRGKGGKR